MDWLHGALVGLIVLQATIDYFRTRRFFQTIDDHERSLEVSRRVNELYDALVLSRQGEIRAQTLHVRHMKADEQWCDLLIGVAGITIRYPILRHEMAKLIAALQEDHLFREVGRSF